MTGLVACTFSLNGQPLSALVCNGQRYPAFSGRDAGRDNPAEAAVPKLGPIPPGVYYIVDRPVGGRFPWLEAFVHDIISHSDRQHWFALYAKGTISDYTFIQGIKRGNFRLHPIGAFKVSDGCITLNSAADFDRLSRFLLGQPTATIPGTKIRYYGTVVVR